jgi:hypothetical protein
MPSIGPFCLSMTKNRSAASVSVALSLACFGRDDLSASLIANSPASLGLRPLASVEGCRSSALAGPLPVPVGGFDSPRCDPPQANTPNITVTTINVFMSQSPV